MRERITLDFDNDDSDLFEGSFRNNNSFTIDFEGKMFGLLKSLRNNNKRCLGLILMVLAGFLLTVGNSLVQCIYDRNLALHVSSFQILFVRSVLQLSFSILFMIYGKVHIYGKKKLIFPLVGMGLAEIFAIVFIYLALERISVGNVTVLQFTAPVFTVLFSFVLLRQGCGFIESIFGTISFLGVLFIAKPDLFGFDHHKSDVKPNIHNVNDDHKMHHMQSSQSDLVIGTMLGLLGAVSLSLFFILSKLNGMKVDVILTVFYPSLFGIVIGPIGMAIQRSPFLISEISGTDWGILVVVGIISFVGMLFMGESLQLEDAGPAILVRNCDVIYAFIMQYILMHHVPSVGAIIGTFIVLSCTSVITINRVFRLEDKYCPKCCCKSCHKQEEVEEEAAFLSAAYQQDDGEEGEEMITH